MTLNKSLSLRRGAAVLAALALAGCAGMDESAPHLDSQMGGAARAIWAAQTLNPQASRNQAPVNGLDGVSAVNVIQSYQQGAGGQSGSYSSGSSSSSGTGGSGTSSTSSR